MGLHHFEKPKGATFKKRRVARGIGSGMGKTATRGTKGQSARRQIHPNFEGGQTAIQRRLPVKKGFRNINHKEFAVVNISDLETLFESGATVTPEALIESRIISKVKDGVKILGTGSLSKKLTVSAHKFSKTAEEAITNAGGSATVIVPAKKEAKEASAE